MAGSMAMIRSRTCMPLVSGISSSAGTRARGFHCFGGTGESQDPNAGPGKRLRQRLDLRVIVVNRHHRNRGLTRYGAVFPRGFQGLRTGIDGTVRPSDSSKSINARISPVNRLAISALVSR